MKQEKFDTTAETGTIADYGFFDMDDSCFVLTAEPPKKWANLHYNKPGEHEIYAHIHQIGDGSIKLRDGVGNECRLVSYDSKYLYIRDEESGTVFNPFGGVVPTDVTENSCRYYAAKTEIRGVCEELAVTQRVFVPRNELFECWTVTVENRSDRERNVSVFGFAKFDLGGRNATGETVYSDNGSNVMPDLNGVYAWNYHRSVPTDRYNGYLVATNHYVGANGYRDHFTRQDFSLSTPKILWGWNCDNRDGWGPDTAGVVQTTFTIQPHSTERVDFLLGQAANVEEVREVLKRSTPENLDIWCDEQMALESKRAKAYSVDTGFGDKDALINMFSKKQMVSYLIDKSGFRDNLQTDMAVAMFDYPMAKDNLLRALASQHADGSVPHGFRPLIDLVYADKPAWILMAVPALVKESGDWSLLDAVVPYLDCAEGGTVWDHMLRAMRYLANDTGMHGLCDQHFADWNDGLEPSEETGERESVMVTQQLAYGALELENMARRLGHVAIESEARELHEKFSKRLNEVCWDGEWYQRTICGSGYRIGTKSNPEAKVFLNTQAWAIMSKTAIGDRAAKCMASIDSYCENEYGFAVAFPPFSKFDHRIGKLSELYPGTQVNGGAYNHAAGFKAVADCMLGRAEEAWRTFVKVMPDSPWNPVGNSKTEPFAFTNCYSMHPSAKGESYYPWRTGTCPWFVMLLVEWMLGARRHYDGLLIDPCLSKEIPRARLTRNFRGSVFEIEIDNSAGRCVGVQSITLDGKLIDGNIISVEIPGEYTVKVVI